MNVEQDRLQSHGKNDKKSGIPEREREKTHVIEWAGREKERKEGVGGFASGPKHDQRLHLPVWRNVKPLILSANVQNEAQTILFGCCLL